MALAKRDAARQYARRRCFLRELARRRLLCAVLAREVCRQIVNHRAAWSVLRRELRV